MTVLQCDQFVGDLTGVPFTPALVDEIRASAFSRWCEVLIGTQDDLATQRLPWATSQWAVQPDGRLALWRHRWDSSG